MIQQSMARISSFYHASATTPLANHSDFFNTHGGFPKRSAEKAAMAAFVSPLNPADKLPSLEELGAALRTFLLLRISEE